MRIVKSNPSPSSVNAPLRSDAGKIVCRANYLSLANDTDGQTDTLNYKPNSGKMDAGLFFRGPEVIPGPRNYHIGMGYYDSAKDEHFCVQSMQDPETAQGLVTRISHSERSFSLICQGASAAAQGTLKEHTIQSHSYDQLLAEKLQGVQTVDYPCWPLIFSNGVLAVKVFNVQLNADATPVVVGLDFVPDMLMMSACFRSDASPEVIDTAPPLDNKGLGGFCIQSNGVALNRSGTPQYCTTWAEKAFSVPDTHHCRNIIRDDAVLSAIAETTDTEDFHLIASFSDNKVTLTPSAAANSAWIGGIAIQFRDPTQLNLRPITIPSAGNWYESGIGFRPQAQFTSYARGVSAYNTITVPPKPAYGWFVSDRYESHVVGGAFTNAIEPQDNTTHCWIDTKLKVMEVNSGVASDILIGELSEFGTDDMLCRISLEAGEDILGWSLFIGE